MTSFDAVNKIWCGRKVERDHTKSFQEIVLNCLRSTPERNFQISDDEETKLTFAEAGLLSIRVAQNLQRFGVQSGEVVSVLLKNSTYAAPIVIGCILLGAPVNPLICRLGINVEWIKTIIATTRPKVILLEEYTEHAELIAQTTKEMGLECKVFVMHRKEKLISENLFHVCELLKETNEENQFR